MVAKSTLSLMPPLARTPSEPFTQPLSSSSLFAAATSNLHTLMLAVFFDVQSSFPRSWLHVDVPVSPLP